jgi:transketolase
MLLAAGRGHLAPALSLVEILRVLYDDVLRLDPANPRWPGRDRFILSKGHGCMALYVMLAERGFFPASELKTFCRAGSMLGGHPEYPRVPGVEASTGSLGHGPAVGLGMALNARHDRTGARIFVVIGDGESNEGSIWEAALSGAKHGLENLTLIVDYNKFQSYGPTREVMNLEPLADKWRSFGWGVAEVDGHSVPELKAVFARLPVEAGKPSVVICHTIKGAGIDCVEHNLQWHHKSGMREDEAQALLDGIGRSNA